MKKALAFFGCFRQASTAFLLYYPLVIHVVVEHSCHWCIHEWGYHPWLYGCLSFATWCTGGQTVKKLLGWALRLIRECIKVDRGVRRAPSSTNGSMDTGWIVQKEENVELAVSSPNEKTCSLYIAREQGCVVRIDEALLWVTKLALPSKARDRILVPHQEFCGLDVVAQKWLVATLGVLGRLYVSCAVKHPIKKDLHV